MIFWKKKEKVKEEEYDCRKRGHIYEIVDSLITFDGKKTTGDYFLLKCEKCNKKNTISTERGKLTELVQMWEDDEISIKEYKKLKDKITKLEEERIKNEKPKTRRKTKKINKKRK